jgi:hypothetical protein
MSDRDRTDRLRVPALREPGDHIPAGEFQLLVLSHLHDIYDLLLAVSRKEELIVRLQRDNARLAGLPQASVDEVLRRTTEQSDGLVSVEMAMRMTGLTSRHIRRMASRGAGEKGLNGEWRIDIAKLRAMR